MTFQYKVVNLTILLNLHCKKLFIRTYVQNRAFEKREEERRSSDSIHTDIESKLKPDIVSICKKILTVWILIP